MGEETMKFEVVTYFYFPSFVSSKSFSLVLTSIKFVWAEIRLCVCVCVCDCESERERERPPLNRGTEQQQNRAIERQTLSPTLSFSPSLYYSQTNKKLSQQPKFS